MLWDNKLSGHITPVPENTQRVQAVIIAVTPREILLVNVYLPTRGYSTSTIEYQETLSSIGELIHKYGTNKDLVLCGDMNARIHERDQRYPQDKLFHAFHREFGLFLPPDFPSDIPTFVSHNARTTIDAVLTNSVSLIESCIIQEQSVSSSPHNPIQFTLVCHFGKPVPSPNPKNGSDRKPAKLLWPQADSDCYVEILGKYLPGLDIHHSPPSIEATLSVIHGALQMEAQKAVPHRKPSSKTKLPWNPDIAQAMKVHKRALSDWVCAGRPPPDHHLSTLRNATKKEFRRACRRTQAQSRENFFSKIMDTHAANDITFYKLIRSQRSSAGGSGTQLEIDGELITDREQVLQAWAKYFGQLSTPSANPKFCQEHAGIISEEVDRIARMEQDNTTPPLVTPEDVEAAISKLNKGKATDPTGLTAEHLILGSPVLCDVLAELFNATLKASYLPAMMRSGCLTPVLKKGIPPPLDPGSYRGITVTSILAKTLEHVMLQKHQESLTQSELQFGFTKSRNPVMAALVLTEAIAEARDQDTPLYVATLDTSKAFDVVDHTSLKRRLYLSNPELWRSTVLLLEDNTSQVKIDCALSPSYPVLQGVGQGRILSTENYKLYIEPPTPTPEATWLRTAHRNKLHWGAYLRRRCSADIIIRSRPTGDATCSTLICLPRAVCASSGQVSYIILPPCTRLPFLDGRGSAIETSQYIPPRHRARDQQATSGCFYRLPYRSDTQDGTCPYGHWTPRAQRAIPSGLSSHILDVCHTKNALWLGGN